MVQAADKGSLRCLPGPATAAAIVANDEEEEEENEEEKEEESAQFYANYDQRRLAIGSIIPSLDTPANGSKEALSNVNQNTQNE